MLNKLSIMDIKLREKCAFIRVDFNVPLDGSQNITDDTRIRASLPTIDHAVDRGAKLILASHLGRPKGKVVPEMSLRPVAERLSELLGRQVLMAPDCIGEKVLEMASELRAGEVMLLENLRFHGGETSNDEAFAKALAGPAEVYVNDAFGTAHRAHASTVGITQFLSPRAAGFLLQKEIEYFDGALAAPERPFIALLGGAKISTKIPVIENLMSKVDKLLIGGGMAFTFLKAGGLETGNSLLEKEMVELAEGYLRRSGGSGKEILLPQDLVIAREFDNDAESRIVSADGIPAGWMGLDIGPQTIENWKGVIGGAGTIVWNGPMGAFEMPSFSRGTVEIARAVAESGAVSIVGGGDSVAALDVAGVREGISHVSTGGGASLDFLAGKTLPAIEVLDDK
ncbi:MAG TPA: phosphoglycerate kinase [Acidobacteriota bacterium]|nr:phosphoglycerate kinase [Acidobacteriota bacterium]